MVRREVSAKLLQAPGVEIGLKTIKAGDSEVIILEIEIKIKDIFALQLKAY